MLTGNISGSVQAVADRASRSETGAKPDAADTAAIDFQSFLQLLTAQLRNQDPLSPLDSTEFVAQLANFSTVEQLVNANQRLDNIASSLVNDAIDQYAGFIGKTAELRSPQVNFTGEPIAFRIPADPAAQDIEIVVTDRFGVELDRFQGANSDALQYWRGENIAPGQYSVHAEYKSGGANIAIKDASTFGVISEVRLTADGADLRLRDGRLIAASDLIGLSEAELQ